MEAEVPAEAVQSLTPVAGASLLGFELSVMLRHAQGSSSSQSGIHFQPVTPSLATDWLL